MHTGCFRALAQMCLCGTTKVSALKEGDILMFERISTGTQSISKRFWLQLAIHTAAQDPDRWPQRAAECDLVAFRSFTSGDTTVFSYADIEVGTITGSPGRQYDNTLHPFMDALRVVVEAYERMIKIADDVRQTGSSDTPTRIALRAVERDMLFSHPQYQALLCELDTEGIFLRIKQTERDGQYTVVVPESVPAP